MVFFWRKLIVFMELEPMSGGWQGLCSFVLGVLPDPDAKKAAWVCRQKSDLMQLCAFDAN